MLGPVRRPRVGIRRRLREFGKRAMRRSFEIGQRLGVNVLPRHFYSGVPDIRALAGDESWKRRRTLTGIAGANDADDQLATLREWLRLGIPEPIWVPACREHGEPGYGPIESDVLYAFIRTEQPKRIVQVGAGVSTAVILRASRDAGYTPHVTCVDPFPTSYLAERARRGEVTLIAEAAQTVDADTLLAIADGDLLFIDSTHTVKPGSEVNRLVFEILPRLPSGAWVHFHDITFPYDYSRGLMTTDLFFWGESTLLQAFLIGNARYEVGLSMSMLHYERPSELRSLLPHYRPQPNDHGLRRSVEGHFPCSIYLRVVS